MIDTEMSLDDAIDFLKEIEGLKRRNEAIYTADAIATVLLELKDTKAKLIACRAELKRLKDYQRQQLNKDCNNCARRGGCKHLPEIGKLTRINCFLWQQAEG